MKACFCYRGSSSTKEIDDRGKSIIHGGGSWERWRWPLRPRNSENWAPLKRNQTPAFWPSRRGNTSFTSLRQIDGGA